MCYILFYQLNALKDGNKSVSKPSPSTRKPPAPSTKQTSVSSPRYVCVYVCVHMYMYCMYVVSSPCSFVCMWQVSTLYVFICTCIIWCVIWVSDHLWIFGYTTIFCLWGLFKSTLLSSSIEKCNTFSHGWATSSQYTNIGSITCIFMILTQCSAQDI